MKIESKHFVVFLLGLAILATSTCLSRAEELLLPERKGFSPGVSYHFKDLNGKLLRQSGHVILNEMQPVVRILLPIRSRNTTYAMICRSRSITEDTFNLVAIKVNGKWVGNYYPCTDMFTNKKLLFEAGGEDIEVQLERLEGPGCLIDYVRLYPAEEAYAIKNVASMGLKTNTKIDYFRPDDAFKSLALKSAKWLEEREDGGLRMLVKRIRLFGKNTESFKLMIRRYIEYLETPELQALHWLGDTSFEMYNSIEKWKEIEDDKRFHFSEAWRLEIINTLYFMARISFIDWSAYRLNRHYRKYRNLYPKEWKNLKIGGYAYQFLKENEVVEVLPRCQQFDRQHPFVPHNHMTHPALSLFHAAKYFERYMIPEVKVWYNIARWTFAPLMNVHKPLEDCYMYQYWAMILAAKYALLDGKDEFFYKEGPLWQYIDLEIAGTNNKGDGVSYGDHLKYGRLSTRFHNQKDVFNALTVNSPIPMSDGFVSLVKEKKPNAYVGLYVHPLDSLFYKHSMDINVGFTIAEDRCFDKISFREGWNVDDQYLLLDGISGGYHGHQDVNAILEFSAKNRTWLIDMGYWQVGIRTAKHHNMITISRSEVNKGEESPIEKTPPFSVLMNKADLSSAAFISAGLFDYNGTDWVRNILWKKGKYFVVLDEINNVEKTPCKATCRWRTLGTSTFADNRFSVTQETKKGVQVKDRRKFVFNIVQLDDSVARVKNGIDKADHWKDYPYAEPVVRVLEQTWLFDENKSNRHVFINVFYVMDEQKDNQIKATRLGEKSIKLSNNDFEEVIGINGIETEGGIKTGAALFIIAKNQIFLCNATFLEFRGKRIFKSEKKRSLELQLQGDEATLFFEKL